MPLSHRPFSLIVAALAQIRLSFALPGPAVRTPENNIPTRSTGPFALEAVPSVSLAPPGSIITAKPLSTSHGNTALADERLHVIIATILAFVLVAICVLIVRHLNRMPFRTHRRSKASKTQMNDPPAPGEGVGFGFDGLSQAQWVAVRDRDESKDASTPGSDMPDMPPAVYLKEDLPLSPIDEKLRLPDVKQKS